MKPPIIGACGGNDNLLQLPASFRNGAFSAR
jgi:hypothetical protein